MRGEKVDELHMEFFSAAELIWEITEDLCDYEDDILKNSFNLLRLFTKMYGASGAPVILTMYIREVEERYNSSLKLIDPQLALNYQKICDEPAKEDGRGFGYFGDHRWNIPNVIPDEDLYRSSKLITLDTSVCINGSISYYFLFLDTLHMFASILGLSCFIFLCLFDLIGPEILTNFSSGFVCFSFLF